MTRDIGIALASQKHGNTAGGKAQPEPKNGYAHFKSWELYHLARTAEIAFRKASELAGAIGQVPVCAAETPIELNVWPGLQDALACAEAGCRYLRMLVDMTRPCPQFEGHEPPF